MPVPVKTHPDGGPRILLRDKIYNQLLEHIQDGTLLPGERLTDDALTGWLEVSRTPIREALGMLVEDGLVELAPNRYTRVVDRSTRTYEDAAFVLGVMHSAALELLDEKDREAVLEAVRSALPALEAHQRQALIDLRRQLGEYVAKIPNELIVVTERRARLRAEFHLPHAARSIDWEHVIPPLEALVN